MLQFLAQSLLNFLHPSIRKARFCQFINRNQNLCWVLYFWDFLGIYGLFGNCLRIFFVFFFRFSGFFDGLFWILEDMVIRECPKWIGTQIGSRNEGVRTFLTPEFGTKDFFEPVIWEAQTRLDRWGEGGGAETFCNQFFTWKKKKKGWIWLSASPIDPDAELMPTPPLSHTNSRKFLDLLIFFHFWDFMNFFRAKAHHINRGEG